jgi:hypothetical protein
MSLKRHLKNINGRWATWLLVSKDVSRIMERAVFRSARFVALDARGYVSQPKRNAICVPEIGRKFRP